MKKDIAINPVSGDIYVSNFDMALVEGIDAIVQSLKIRLSVFKGEWFLDTEAGLPYFDDILIKNPNIPNVENLIKAMIIETEGITEILKFDLINENRELSVSFEFDSIYGIGNIEQSLFVGA